MYDDLLHQHHHDHHQALEAMKDAIQGFDHEHLHQLLVRDPSLATHQDSGGHSGFWYACIHGNLPAAQMLLDHGAVLDVITASGRSHLMACVAGNSAVATKWLLDTWLSKHEEEEGELSIIERRSYAGHGPLWRACFDGRESAARILIAYGADDQISDINGTTCMQAARMRREWQLIHLLKEAERCYFLARVRALIQTQRAAAAQGPPPPPLPDLPSSNTTEIAGHHHHPKKEKGDDDDACLDVSQFVTEELTNDLFVELVVMMKGSV